MAANVTDVEGKVDGVWRLNEKLFRGLRKILHELSFKCMTEISQSESAEQHMARAVVKVKATLAPV